MIYADYGYYKDTYKGTLIKEEDYDHSALLASDYMDSVTFNRLVDLSEDEITNKVRTCMCRLAEAYQEYEQNVKNGGRITRETVGRYTKEYGRGMSEVNLKQEQDKTLLNIARQYLTYPDNYMYVVRG